MSLRLFVALLASEPVAAEVARARAHLAHGAPDVRLRGTDRTRPHLTLRFLGDTEEGAVPALAAAVRAAARAASPLTVRTGGLGAFPSWRRPTVAWLALEGDLVALADLRRELLDALPAGAGGRDPERFVPHLTVARLPALDDTRRAALRRLAEGFRPGSVRWTVRHLALVRSELRPDGARHRVLARAALGGATAGDGG